MYRKGAARWISSTAASNAAASERARPRKTHARVPMASRPAEKSANRSLFTSAEVRHNSRFANGLRQLLHADLDRERERSQQRGVLPCFSRYRTNERPIDGI
jgi:hypothetical protein